MTDAPKDIKCERCRVTVPIDKVDVPDRCMDVCCPLKRRGVKHEEKHLGRS